MGRPRIRAGELGAIQITRLAAGSYRARARARDDAGTLHQLVVVAGTEDAARLALQRKMEASSSSMFAGLAGANTIAEAGAAWLEQVHARAIAGSLTFSTYESYETIVRCVLVPQCGGITLDALTVGRCDRIIQAILLQRSVSAARRARVVLGQICGYAVRDDAIRYNPVRDVQRLPLAEEKTSILTHAQIAGIRELMQHWREKPTNGPRSDYRALIDGMDIMLGTSARVGECIGLRRRDVDMTTAPPTLLIDGTIVQTKEHGITRKDSPKRTRQRRRVSLPVLAAAAVRRRLALADRGKDALLFATKNGNPISVSSGLSTLIMPAFEQTTVGELTAGRLERFLKAQRAKSYPAAKRSKALLNHLIRYAMLHGAIAHNPVQATSSLRRPPTYNKALTIEEINAIRKATRVRSHGPGTPGPKADQQLADIIEVMLGTSARIGEALALRNRDLDLTAMPPTVHICGTVVVRKGNGTYRQPFPKTVTSNRIVAIPEFAAEALRARVATRGNSDPEQLVFSTKSGAPLNPSNVRRTFRQIIQLAGLSDRAVELHSLRKTVATLISQHAGEETAAHMLGHSGTQTLRQHYIERTRRPQPATAEILGRLAPRTLGFPRDDVADSA